MDLVSESEGSGVQVAQQAVTQRGFALNQILNLAHIQLGLRNRFEHTQIVDLVGWNFMRREHFRAAKEVSLEIEESSFLGGYELLAGFHFFRQHAAAPGPIAF